MASESCRTLYTICIQADNWFHTGWLYGILGLAEPSWDDPDHPIRDIDIDSFREGMETAKETGFCTPKAMIPLDKTFQRMASIGNLKFHQSL